MMLESLSLSMLRNGGPKMIEKLNRPTCCISELPMRKRPGRGNGWYCIGCGVPKSEELVGLYDEWKERNRPTKAMNRTLRGILT